ncbi:MAG TPA: hypothetical protein VL283_00965 [Candidatus Baltobacteraceae bacterium]|nr:hypothetical protein [Candidatus Baltobacteraceae bacterium]
MARARRMEAPMAEEPKESQKFDVSDLETTAAETPKAKRKKAAMTKVERTPAKPGKKKPLPGVATSDVADALDMVRETAEESEWDAKIAEAKRKAAEEETSAVPAKSEVEESLKELRGIAEEREWERKIAEAKTKADEEGQVIEFEAEPQSEAERKEEEEPYAEISVEPGSEAEEMSEEDRALAAYREAHPVLTDNEGYRKLGMKQQAEEALSKGYEARKKREAKEAAAKETVNARGFTDKEEAWFKKGEEDEARQMAEARATIERGGKGELMVENPEDYAANLADAAALVKKGELSSRDFSLADYEYLLKERIRIDQELEHAGWWKARQLRKDLAKIQKGGYGGASGSQGLDDYEKEIMAVKTGAGAARLDAAEKNAPAKKKPSFWERLRMDKGR